MSLDVSTDSGMSFIYDKVNKDVEKKAKNPLVIAVLVAVVLLYVVLFNIMGKKPVKIGSQQTSHKMIELFAWALFLLLIFLNALQYFFEINIQTVVKNLFDSKSDVCAKKPP